MSTRPHGSPSLGAARRRSEPARTQLTARGCHVLIAGTTTFGAALGALLSAGLSTGLSGDVPLGVGFVGGCAFAILRVRRTDLCAVVVSPPLIFGLVVLVTEAFGAFGQDGFLGAFSIGVATTLASGAGSLFLGTALVVAVALPRGLVGNVRELRKRWQGARPHGDDDPVRWDEDPDDRRRRG